MENELESSVNTVSGNHGGTLTPFRPGQSGNPKGKSKGDINFTTLLKRLLKEKVALEGVFDSKGKPLRITKQKAILLRWLERAMQGNINAIEKIVERIDGKPVQPIAHSGEINGDDPVKQMATDLNTLVRNYGNNAKPASTPDSETVGTDTGT